MVEEEEEVVEEEEEVLGEVDQWGWVDFSREVCQNYALLEMVHLEALWVARLCAPQEPVPMPLVPPWVAPRPPLRLTPTNPLLPNSSAHKGPLCPTSPALPATAVGRPVG